jgi:UDP-glucuronate 4-epimerase
MTVQLVTGCAGFIGYHLCEALLAEGCTVLGVDNLNDYYDSQLKRDRLSCLESQCRFSFQLLDLADQSAVAQLFSDSHFDTVYHFAAQAGVRYSLENPHAYIESNITAFVNVLEGCRSNPPRHLVYASSSSVYGANDKIPFSVSDPVERPVSLYGVTKRSNELLAFTYSHIYGLRSTGLRLFTVYGPWGRPDMAVYKFTRAMLSAEPIDVFNFGQMRRDFTYVADAVNGIIQSARRLPAAGGDNDARARCAIYNIGSNHPVELRELISTLEECLGVKAKLRLLDIQPGDLLETYADIELSEQDFGFQPRTTLRQGLERFVTWYRSYHGDGTCETRPTALAYTAVS